MKTEAPRIFSPFGIGPANCLRRCDGSYRLLTRTERLLNALFGVLPADVWEKPKA